jgi:predicted membrane-bound spermidine synthase
MTPERREPALPFSLLAVCFLGSGFTGLVYELLWTRRLQLTFGSTTYSITAVLAAFMAGLGLGGYLIGRRVDRSRLSPVRIYAYLELGVGLYALASLPLLSLCEWLYAALQAWLGLGQWGAALLKLLLAFPVLAFPAALMGGTLPALTRALCESRSTLHLTVSRLYGVNTIGAATGTALTGLVLIESLGIWQSMVLAALVNLSIAALVLGRLRREPAEHSAPAEPIPEAAAAPELRLRAHLRSPAILFCAIAVTLTGFLSMLYQIVWTRMISLVVGSSSYAFAIVLAIFLLGLALGALLYSRTAASRPPAAGGLAVLLLGLGLWVTLTLSLIPLLPEIMIRLAQIPGVGYLRLLAFELVLALTLLLVPTLILGAALPMSMGIVSRALGQLGRDVGGVYLANTGGAIAGSVLTGFALIPLLGSERTLLIGVLLNLVLAAVGILAFGGPPLRRAIGLAGTLAVTAVCLMQPSWPPSVFDSGLGTRLDAVRAKGPLELARRLERAPSRLRFLEEGVNATVSVREFPNQLTLLVNGKPDASTGGDMTTQATLGAIPLLAHPRPTEVAVIGFGSGVTAHVATFFPEVQRIDVVEIERAVLRAAPLFRAVNGGVEEHAKVNLLLDDARSLLRTSSRRYDVIISEPSNPWMAGVASLFSADYYELARRRLKPGGIFGQWLQLYRIDAEAVAMILRTMLTSFPEVEVWHADAHNLILLGSDGPIRHSLDRVERAYRADHRLRVVGAAFGPGPQAEHFFGCFLLGRGRLEQIVSRFGARRMTDDHPILEYHVLRGLFLPTHDHVASLWDAKLDGAGALLPRHLTGRAPSLGLVLAGAVTMLRRHPLEDRIGRYAMERFRDEPQLRLVRAKTLDRLGRSAEARELARSLPQEPGFRAEAALLEARILLREKKPAEALARLEGMSRFRPVARLWYQLEAALALGRGGLAWSSAEALQAALDERYNIDVINLPRDEVYLRFQRLIEASRLWERGLRLLERRREPAGGEYHRQLALVATFRGMGQPKRAARAMDALLEFGLPTPELFTLCEQTYRAAGEPAAAEACVRTRERYTVKPLGRPLWERPGR